jgi:hypothetical protein
MDDLIKDELRAIVQDWNAGKQLQVIPLGHRVRVEERKTEHGTTETSEVPVVFRQRVAYECTFRLIDALLDRRPLEFPEFLALSKDVDCGEMSKEERDAALSMAWLALRRGWRFALSGFPATVTISREVNE